MTEDKPNRPRAPANQRQHIPGDYGDKDKPSDAEDPRKHPNEPSETTENADPHPATEEGYGRDSKVPTTGL